MRLHAGDWVEVRSRAEILATLDEQASLDAMPFMPEMLEHCGKRFRVYKSAHKTCDTIGFQGARKLERAVHLEGLRCDGSQHGGCQAGCLLFWKTAWLRKVDPREPQAAHGDAPTATSSLCTERTLFESTRRALAPDETVPGGTEVFRCQATELNRASEVLPWWDFRQYVKDLWTGNIGFGWLLKAFSFWLFTKTLRLGAYRAQLRLYEAIRKRTGGIPFPYQYGNCEHTPTESLNLQAGEWVRIKPQAEILKTVNRMNRNRGLSFDEEMVGFCGGTYRVLRRVERIIQERTGQMTQLKGGCIVLDGVTCQSRFKDQRLFCPRSIFPYWREIWLQRTDPPGKDPAA